MKRLSWLLVVLVVGAGLMAPSVGWSQPKYGGTLVYGVESDLNTIDPQKAIGALDGIVFQLMTEALVLGDKNYDPQPGLAESWETLADGKEWIFHLRKGVKFHNGREMTAEDVKFSFDRVMEEKTGSPLRPTFDNVDSLEIVDPYTVKFILKKPAGSFISRLYNPVTYSFSIIAKECVNEDGSITHPIGTGPFEFVEWKTNDYVKFKKFKDYRIEGLPYIDEIIVKPVPDNVVRLNAVRAGDLDVALYLPVNDIARFRENPVEGCQFALGYGPTWYVHFNTSQPPFNDVRVRQAVAYGMNKNEIMMGAAFGLGEVLNQPYTKNFIWYVDVPDVTRDIDKAKALLKEAGYPNGLDVTIVASNAYPEQKITAEILQAQLKEIGLNVSIDVSDWPTFVKKVSAMKFEFGVNGWPIPVDPSDLFDRCFTPTAAYGFLAGKYDNPQVTRLLEEGATVVGVEKRKEIYTKVVRILTEEFPWIFILHSPSGFGWRSYVKDFNPPHVGFVYAGGGLQYVWLDK